MHIVFSQITLIVLHRCFYHTKTDIITIILLHSDIVGITEQAT